MNLSANLEMPPRNPHEPHRAATPLELLFDLVSVIAIAAAAASLHHAISQGHGTAGIIGYLMVFFPIWWAWMNFTWFASAYDNDDAFYRIMVMVIMGGALLIASGVERFFEQLDITLVVAGYVLMRIGLVVLWLRAAMHDPARRTTTLRYAVGITLAQVYWIALAFADSLDQRAFIGLILLGFVIELAVPAYAESAATTPWHRHHIIERYGLLVIIVLGEVLLAAAMALSAAWDGTFDVRLVHVAISALVITFAMWWLYFLRDDHLQSNELRHALQWGYGHIVVFASGAAVGSGFGVLVDVLTGHGQVSIQTGDLAVALPLASYMLGLWIVRDRLVYSGAVRWVLPVFAVLIAVLPLVMPALEVIAATLVLALFVHSWLRRRRPAAVR